jgi:CRP-like cAMP-binding protein
MLDLASESTLPRFGGSAGAAARDGAMAAVLRRLGGFAVLTAAEAERVRALASARRRMRTGAVLLAEGRAGRHFLLSGWACRQRVLRDGRRQIFDVIAPGEGFGWGEPADGYARQTVAALTPVETVDAAALIIGQGDGASGGLARALRGMLLEQDARRLDHMIRLGRLTAVERVAHFVLEVQRRVGAVEMQSFPLPLTQEAMADVLGLSVVHLNRVLRQLRAAGLFELRRGMATVVDPKAMAAAAVLPPAAERLQPAR